MNLPALPALDEVERVDQIDRPEFEARFLQPGVPVVLRRLADGWPALTRWTPEFFRDHFGDRTVFVRSSTTPGTGFARHHGGLSAMSMREYMEAVLQREVDLRLSGRATRQFVTELLPDYTLPSLGKNYSRGLDWLFLGPRGSHTKLHFDFGPFHVFHTVIFGKKTLKLFAPSQSRALHRALFTARSPINLRTPDLTRFPRLAEARGWTVTLEKGDTLFLPKTFWHDVYYDEASLSLTLRFTEDTHFVRARLAGRIALAAVSDVLERIFGRGWLSLQERLS